MFLETHTLYTIALTILFTSFGIPFLKSLFGPNPVPKVRWLQITTLPSMNRFDLTQCLALLGSDPLSAHIWLVNYTVGADGVATIKLGYLDQGQEYKHTVTCQINNSLKPKYPLSKRK